ncbi:MAG: type II toxin-antitoxin system VapC family toxin [Thermodesulfobacteriota bacterium]
MLTKSPKMIVLDAWAVLALIFGEEPAAGVVKGLFEKEFNTKSAVYMSWINLGEVYYTIARRKGQEAADEVLNDLDLLPITTHEPSKSDILSAAKLKAHYKLSYADAFALSLAQTLDGTLFTGDPEIVLLEGLFKIERLLRES